MAVNMSRSMNAELIEGASDGSIKKPLPNRGGTARPDPQRELLFNGKNGYGYGPFANPMDDKAGVVRGC